MRTEQVEQEFWQEEAAKSGIPHLGRIIGELVHGQKQIIKKLEDMEEKHNVVTTDVNQLKIAFPSQDFDGHRRYHQVLIDTLEERRKLRKAIQEKTLSGLIWSLIVWGATMVWSHLPKLWEK